MTSLFGSPSAEIPAARSQNGVLLAFFAFCFVSGSFLGTFFGSSLVLSPWIFDIDFETFKVLNISALDFLRFSRFQLIAFIVGASIFGTAFIPVILIARGFTFSLSAATIISAFGDRGIIIAFAIMAIQILVSLPCLIIISADSFKLSRSLFSFLTGKHTPADKSLFAHFIVSLPILFAASVIEKYIFQFAVSRFG